MLLKTSFIVSILWLVSIVSMAIVFQQRLPPRYDESDVTQAQHEQLRAEMEVNDARASAALAVSKQRVDDMAEQVKENGTRLTAIESTIHIGEGIAISFGAVMVIVQGMLFLSHRKLAAGKE